MSENTAMLKQDLPSAMPVACTFGRLIDRPDLSGYRAKAVVDWIDVEFSFARVRSVYALQRALGASHVKELTAKKTRGTEFRARLQDPLSAWDVRRRLAALDPIDVRVTGVEIAVDFYPLHAQATAGMATMSAHLLRGLKNPLDFARFGKNGPGIDQLQSFEATIRQFDAGHTCYLGHRGDRHQQRLYVKRTNDSGKAIPASEHRVRIENTYAAPEGLDGVLDGLLSNMIGSNDFAFRRMLAPTTAMMSLLVSRVAQAGARVRRSNRTLYDRNTKADSELNRRVYDALRGLYTRWAAEPRVAEIAEQVAQVPLCEHASSDYYTSVSTECQALPEQADAQQGVVSFGDASKVEGRSNEIIITKQEWMGRRANTSIPCCHGLGIEREQTSKHAIKLKMSSLSLANVMRTGRILKSAADVIFQKPVMSLVDAMRSTLSGLMTVVRSGSSKINTKVCAAKSSWSRSSIGLPATVLAALGMSQGRKFFVSEITMLLYTQHPMRKSRLHA